MHIVHINYYNNEHKSLFYENALNITMKSKIPIKNWNMIILI